MTKLDNAMRVKAKRKSRLTRELLETAEGMLASGVMDNGTYVKITIRHSDGESRVLPMSKRDRGDPST
jgi:hypothetical protein